MTPFWGISDLEPSATPAGKLFAPADPSPIAPVPAALSGLAITADHYLIVGTLQPGGLLVFDLYAEGPPRRLCWPEAVPLEPFDIAARECGGVWILDRRHRRYWALDRHLRVEGRDQSELTLRTGSLEVFQPAQGAQTHVTAPRLFPQGSRSMPPLPSKPPTR